MFSKFLPIAMKVLKINKLPKIELKARIEDEAQPTFGSYVNDEVTIYLAMADRHPVDILRTFAHELVHFKQHTLGLLGAHSGDTGSPEENQAHEVAGVIMRYFNKRYPAYLKSKPLVFEHKKGVRARKYNKKPQKYIEPVKPEGTKEDYHPNDPPPGPEFKPTMPKGTVKVDVTDVYDWYKLGKNIANLDRAKASEFGKGPPSTIISFGDEETEHKYIKNLQKLGLTTTDIDPVDPTQPKGMKRQKVDPTYNVNEGKKKKRKVRKAAYGPGPFGSYGYAAGYSGDAGAGDGGVGENFADGKNPQDKGDSKRHGVPTKASVSTLRKVAKEGGRKGQLAHWMANMKSGRKK